MHIPTNYTEWFRTQEEERNMSIMTTVLPNYLAGPTRTIHVTGQMAHWRELPGVISDDTARAIIEMFFWTGEPLATRISGTAPSYAAIVTLWEVRRMITTLRRRDAATDYLSTMARDCLSALDAWLAATEVANYRKVVSTPTMADHS